MIIYYLETGEIQGISHQLDVDNLHPYIETTDPIAEAMLSGEASPIGYKVINGELVKNTFTIPVSNPKIIENRIYQIPIELSSSQPDVHITQTVSTKHISVELSQLAVERCKELKLTYIILTACPPNDPFVPLWTITVPIVDNHGVMHSGKYLGSDNLRFYTNKVFTHYYHEIK